MRTSDINQPDIVQIFETLPGLYLILSPQLMILTASNAYLEATFTNRDDIMGKYLFDVFPDNPETPEANAVSNLHYSLDQVLFNCKPHKMAIQHYDIPDPARKGGFIERYWSPLNTPVMSTEGEVKYIIHQVINVTESVKAEMLLKDSQNRERAALEEAEYRQHLLHSLFEQAPVAIAIFKDSDYIIELANQAVCEIWGGRQSDIVGRPLFEALPEIREFGIEKLLESVIVTGEPYQGNELPINIKKAGRNEVVYFNFIYHPLLNQKQATKGVIVIASDVSAQVIARHRLELSEQTLRLLNNELEVAGEEIRATNEELQAINEELYKTQETLKQVNYDLEKKVGERTNDLYAAYKDLAMAHEEILLANKELEKTNSDLTSTNRDLDNFIYTASHDLKAPISNIEGLIYSLKRDLPPEILEEENITTLIDFIEASIERFKKTIGQLTSIIELQKENNQEIIDVSLSDIIEEVRLDLEILIKKEEAILELHVQDCPTILFSQKNLRSVIYNLLSNAIKYRSPDRQPLIRIGCEKKENYVILSVSDNGLGMDLSKEAKVFAMFGRLHTHVEGSGVGLYIVKKMIENDGGKIEVESQVGIGSTFKVYFKY